MNMMAPAEDVDDEPLLVGGLPKAHRLFSLLRYIDRRKL